MIVRGDICHLMLWFLRNVTFSSGNVITKCLIIK